MRREPKNNDQVTIQEDSVPSEVGHREKRTAVRAKKGKDDEISSPQSTRILRSRTQEKPKQLEPPIIVHSAENGDSKKRKKKQQAENLVVDEFSKLRRNMSYVVNRIKYEQTLINAYSAEGWKRQSLEKIRPEKELQRAKSEIFRRKSVIRDLFLRIDQMCNEGIKIPKTSSDSTGEIDSDDLCCSKCGSKENPANKEIIICDGCCERGFHLSCLEPPILKKDLHLYADNWLCPACDCKFDCIDLVNDLHGTDLSMTDSWEKVFPEILKNQDEDSGLPSGDNDVDPGRPVSDDEVEESNDSTKVLPNVDPYLGLPSDDSEDDDFDPIIADDEAKKESSSSDFTSDSEDFSVAHNDDNGKNLSEDVAQVSSKSNDNENDNEEEEDYAGVITAKRNVERLDYKKLHDEEYGSGSSDSSDEDFMDNSIKKNTSGKKKRGKNSSSPDNEDVVMNPSETKSTPKSKISKKTDVEETSKSPSNGKSTSKSTKKRRGQAVTKEENGSVSSDSNDEDHMDNNIKNKASGKKRRGKKVSSASPDKEDLTVSKSKSTRKRRISKKVDVEGTSISPSKGKSTSKSPKKRLGEAATKEENGSSYPDPSGKKVKENGIGSSDNENLAINPSETENTPRRSITKNGFVEGTSKPQSSGISTSNSKSANRRLGEAVTKRLSEYFNENQYPDVATKESLAKEVGITAHQVNKWFMNTRWSYNHPSAGTRSKVQKNNNNT